MRPALGLLNWIDDILILLREYHRPNRKQTSVALRRVNSGTGLRTWTRELSSCNQSSRNNTARAGERFHQWLWIFIPGYNSLFKDCLKHFVNHQCEICFPYWSVTHTMRVNGFFHCINTPGFPAGETDTLWLQGQAQHGDFSFSYGRCGLRLPSHKNTTGWT